jgi:hypothetical protein
MPPVVESVPPVVESVPPVVESVAEALSLSEVGEESVAVALAVESLVAESVPLPETVGSSVVVPVVALVPAVAVVEALSLSESVALAVIASMISPPLQAPRRSAAKRGRAGDFRVGIGRSEIAASRGRGAASKVQRAATGGRDPALREESSRREGTMSRCH